MNRMQWKPLHGSLRTVLRKSSCFLPVCLCFLNACVPPPDEHSITVRAWSSAGNNAPLNISAEWNELGDMFVDLAPGLERVIMYNLIIRRGVGEGINITHRILVGYDPFTEIYYFNNNGDEIYFADLVGFREHLQKPVSFSVPPDTMTSLAEQDLRIQVRATVSRLSEKSTFQRWLLSPYKQRGYGEVYRDE